MRHAAVALTALIWLNANAAGFDVRYWAWQRSEPSTDAQVQQLATQNVTTLYWHAGELEQGTAGWTWKARFNLPELRYDVIPVIRLETRQHQPFAPESLNQLVPLLAAAANPSGELQLDYDCPDALISDYAAMLQALRARVPHVSITALPHWSRSRAVHELGRCVDELLPMFYDFEPDPVRPGAAPIPLLQPEKIASYLRDWDGVETLWRVGLPVFARATVFDANGKSRGHIRQWSWDDICFNSALAFAASTDLGVTKFRAERETRVGNASVRGGQILVARLVDRAALAQAVSGAKQTNARGTVFFRLPDSTDPSGWSLSQLANPNAAPHFALHFDPATSQMELTNDGKGDLLPQFDPTSGRGYALQIEAPIAIFRDANEGDFWRLISHVHADDASRRAVPVPLATRLTFWFSALRAHETLRTGAIRLASGAELSQTRYRILNFAPQSNWQAVAP